MAPRQLLLELEEVDIAAEKGSKRVRTDRQTKAQCRCNCPPERPPASLHVLMLVRGLRIA
eukprot:scaffold1075_cov129-Isochrysis_galbana.AAC.3